MVFSSYTFAVFITILLSLFYMMKSWKGRKLLLLIGSYIFYSAWNLPFVALIWLSTIVDWFLAKAIYQSQSTSQRRLLLVSSLVLNLGLLTFFKYSNFLLENFIELAALAGVSYNPAKLDIILPVGISFYTFQTLSYTFDVYRGQLKPWKSFLDYALYVTFFPQLVAGPIVRARDFLPQCSLPNKITLRHFEWGIVLFIIGLFLKVTLADGLLAPIVERIYDRKEIPDMLSAWAGTFAFSGQIFADFSGYSTCAIGIAMMFGFALPDNFRAPYAAIGFSDFWRRWHISLSSWLKDYLYISLGGNRKGWFRTQVNLVLTMLIGGLWHGASWNFVIWGGIHGSYLIAEHYLKRYFGEIAIFLRQPSRLALAFLTFILVSLTWVFFRANTFERSQEIIASMFGIAKSPATLNLIQLEILLVFIIMTGMLSMHWIVRDQPLEEIAKKIPKWLSHALLAGMLVSIAMSTGEDRAFIYFQF